MTQAILALLVTAALSGAAVPDGTVQAAPAEGRAICCEWADGDCIPARDGTGRPGCHHRGKAARRCAVCGEIRRAGDCPGRLRAG